MPKNLITKNVVKKVTPDHYYDVTTDAAMNYLNHIANHCDALVWYDHEGLHGIDTEKFKAVAETAFMEIVGIFLSLQLRNVVDVDIITLIPKWTQLVIDSIPLFFADDDQT